jgi:DNA polymerase (family 10)
VPRLPSIEHRLTRAQGDKLARFVCKELGLVIDKNVFICGSLRRECGYIGDIDLLAVNAKSSPDFVDSVKRAINKSEYVDYQRGDESEQILRLHCDGLKIDLYIAERDHVAPMLLFLTGSKFFNISMRLHAKRRGYKLTAYALLKNDKIVKTATERDIFRKLGLSYRDPRYRCIWVK